MQLEDWSVSTPHTWRSGKELATQKPHSALCQYNPTIAPKDTHSPDSNIQSYIVWFWTSYRGKHMIVAFLWLNYFGQHFIWYSFLLLQITNVLSTLPFAVWSLLYDILYVCLYIVWYFAVWILFYEHNTVYLLFDNPWVISSLEPIQITERWSYFYLCSRVHT